MATPAPKKRRQIEDNHWPEGDETAKGTTTIGLKLLDSLRRSQDKTGRLVATEFLQLPPRTNTDYYRQIKLPLSFHEIQKKLDARQYGTMTALEADLKRMVQNAKEFNASSSRVYEDAERIRKALSNFMPKHNPAYKDQDYRALPASIPDDNDDDDDDDHVNGYNDPGPASAATVPAPIKLKINGSTNRKSVGGTKDESAAMGSENMQQEQLKIVKEMIELRDPDDADTEITLEFYEKPSKRDYPDYYRQISHPTALKDIQRAVSNNKFPTWESFVTEVEYVWENARTYNEEGSFIHENANKLRIWFEKRLSSIEGNQDIMAPKKLIIKPPKIPSQQPTPRIKFTSSHKDLAQAGIAIDEEARKRQDEHVRAASRGQIVRSTETPVRVTQRGAARRDSPNPDPSASQEANLGAARSQDAPIPSVGEMEITEDLEGDSSMKDAPADNETSRGPSDNQGSNRRTPSTAPMLPPAVVSQQPALAQSAQAPSARLNYPSSTAFDRVMRDPGKSIKDALYTRILARTNPDLQHPHPWLMNFFPLDTQTQHGNLVHLPPSHSWLRITLGLSEGCLNRAQYNAVVSRDLVKLIPESPDTRGMYAWDFRLHTGVNTICIDVMATIWKRGEPEISWPQERHDFERFVLTVNLLALEP